MTRKQRKNTIRIIVSAVLFVLAYLLPIHSVLKIILFVASYIVVGYDVLIKAFKGILNRKLFDEKFLMTIATLGAFALKEYPEAVAVMLFYQIGELFQSIAVGKSRKSISDLMDICPLYAVVLRDGKEQTVSPDEVMIGETIVIKPGEKIPLDGEISAGDTSVNTSALTGESLPADKTAGDKVISGSINLTGVIRVTVNSVYNDSTVARILELVENSSDKKAHVESFITRFARYYTPFVVVSALILALLPPLISGGGWAQWLERALVFLVVSCPCALVISVPLSFFGGIGSASRRGILIKGANYLEMLSQIDTVVFDKTGTLTKGNFKVYAVHSDVMSRAQLLDIAATAESHSTHPVAESIIAEHGKDIDVSRIGNITELSGMGLCAVVDNKTYYVGNGKLMDRIGADWHECHIAGTTIHIAVDNIYLGHIVITDEVKSNSQNAIKSLEKLGIKNTVMLTGDNESIAQSVAQKTGVEKVYSELLPAQKVQRVEELIDSGAKTAFVGDGINDAPVLTRADVGIAMGAMGSDAAIESADIVLMDDNLEKLAEAVSISRRTMRIVWQNIIFALGIKAIILVLGALGIANMWIAVFGDVGVMVLAILNSMRMLIKRTK